MELIRLHNISRVAILFFLILGSCSKDDDIVEEHNYHYIKHDAKITAQQIGDGSGTLDPRGIAIANDKLYVCNGDVLDVFNAQSLHHIKTITSYTKGETNIEFANLTAIAIDSGRIYLGSTESRLFVIDETTGAGINVVGNGQWWTTFVHVFGVTVGDGLLFVKEKQNSIKVFETSQITETSDWNIDPIAKLNTVTGGTEVYSMDVEDGNLVVAGRNAEAFLYYNTSEILSNAQASLTTPILPTYEPVKGVKPFAIDFTEDWAITSEKVGANNHLRFYPKHEFMKKGFTAKVDALDVMGENPFGEIYSIAQLEDRIFLSDNTNQAIKVIRLKTSSIIER